MCPVANGKPQKKERNKTKKRVNDLQQIFELALALAKNSSINGPRYVKTIGFSTAKVKASGVELQKLFIKIRARNSFDAARNSVCRGYLSRATRAAHERTGETTWILNFTLQELLLDYTHSRRRHGGKKLSARVVS